MRRKEVEDKVTFMAAAGYVPEGTNLRRSQNGKMWILYSPAVLCEAFVNLQAVADWLDARRQPVPYTNQFQPVNGAYITSAIIEISRNSLRSGALPYLRAQTNRGRLTAYSADDVRVYHGHGEILHRDEWVPIWEQTIREWAANEHLNWMRPDGSIERWDEVRA